MKKKTQSVAAVKNLSKGFEDKIAKITMLEYKSVARPHLEYKRDVAQPEKVQKRNNSPFRKVYLVWGFLGFFLSEQGIAL